MKTNQLTASQSTFIDPAPSPLAPAVPETCDIPRQSETFTDTRTPNTHVAPPPSSPRLRPMPDTLRAHARILRVESVTSGDTAAPNTRPTPDPPPSETYEICVESEIFADTDDRIYRKTRSLPAILTLASLQPHHALTDVHQICDIVGQSEPFAASPAHRPASDVQLLTPNSQLLASTSPPRRTRHNTGQR